MNSRAKTILPVVVWVVVCMAGGGLSAYVSGSGPDEWYQSLTKPAFMPPSWAFGVVWPILYLMMGVGAGLIWSKGVKNQVVRNAIVLFSIQFFLNLLWSPLFFGLHRIGWALVEIIVLWAAIALTLRAFWKVQPIASILLWPYLLWVSFATVLNATLYSLNH